MATFTPPEFWNFKPMFTLQPVAATREKQLIVWRDMILQYCRINNQHVLMPHVFPYFKNDAIDRQLSKEGIDAVIEFLIKSGNAEWQDMSQASLRIIWKSPQALAGEIYSWACTADVMGTVYTIYELYAGDENQDSGFHGVDPVILRRALDILQSNHKCVIMKGATLEEDGVKFLSVA